VLINGAGGGSGSFAIQLAKQAGAHVTAVDNGRKLDHMRSLGADEVLDYQRDDFTCGRPLAGEMCISVDRTFALDDVAEALAHVGAGRALGKVVVEPR
jgi:NADPH:quinone reductase-like Zn-dependent oxidoreductase